jgi:diguanylate cyclase (GGDEF)-like protein
MPSFASPSVSRPSDKAAVQRQRLSVTGYWLVLGTGGGLTVAAVPFAIATMLTAPAQLWVEAAFACVADRQPVRVPVAVRRWATFVVSICFCFPIMLLYGIGAALVVQVVAVSLAARPLRLSLADAAFVAARLACSLAVAGGVARLLGVTAPDFRHALTIEDAARIGLTIAAFVAVSAAINFSRAWLSGSTRGEIGVQFRFDLLSRGSTAVLGVAIAAIPGAWAVSLLIVPLLGWSQLARALNEQGERLEHDPVTGLLSRYGLDMGLLNLPRSQWSAPDEFAVIVIQFGSIAYISRSFGRDAVENVLVAAAQRLQEATGPKGLAGRVSDSQMVVILPSQPDERAAQAARRIAGALSAPIDLVEGVPLRLDPLAGVAIGPQDGRDLAHLIPHAEAALFEAVACQAVARVYSPVTPPDVDDRLALLQRLSRAVNDPARASEIRMLYQPQVSIRTGRVDSVEALLRWTDPERGLVPTDELIRTAEPTGLMQQLTLLVLDRVARQVAEWNRRGIRLRAAANASVLDLIAEGFDIQVRNVLDRHQIPTGQLDIEVTERAMVEDTLLLDEAAQRMAKLGVGLSLDDFGTGFSTLRRLRRLPLTEVKIDRAYVSKLADSPADRAMVTAIHELARALGLRVVAEGIEDEATADILARFDGMIGQGWYYARPMPAPDLVQWLRDRGASTGLPPPGRGPGSLGTG